MKHFRQTLFKGLLLTGMLCEIIVAVNAQTSGTLNISFGTYAPNGTWGPSMF